MKLNDGVPRNLSVEVSKAGKYDKSHTSFYLSIAAPAPASSAVVSMNHTLQLIHHNIMRESMAPHLLISPLTNASHLSDSSRRHIAIHLLSLLVNFGGDYKRAVLLLGDHSSFYVYWWSVSKLDCITDELIEETLDEWVLKSFSSVWNRDLKNCPLRVMVSVIPPYVIPPEKHGDGIWEGSSIELIKVLSNHLQFTFVLRKETSINVLSEIAAGRGDLALVPLILTPEHLYDFHTTNAYQFETYVWVVPTADPVPRWRSLFACFTPELWTATVVTALTGAASLQMVLHGTQMTLGNIWLCWLCALVGLPAPKQNTAKVIAPRIIIISLDIFCMLARTAFLSALASLLANPGRQPQIKTLEDIAQSNLDLVFAPEFDQYFEDDTEPLNKEIQRRRASDDDVMEALGHIANSGHYATITTSTTMSYLGRAHGGARLHAAESLGGGPLALFLRHGALSPSLDERVDAALLATAAAGLPDLWEDRLAFKLSVEHEAEHAVGVGHEKGEGEHHEEEGDHEEDHEEREAADGVEGRTAPLALKHVPTAFVVLGVGAMLAALVFVGEVLWAKCKRSNKEFSGKEKWQGDFRPYRDEMRFGLRFTRHEWLFD